MLIALDLDSVLADIVPSMFVFHNKHYGTKNKLSDHMDYALSKTWGCSPEEVVERVYHFYKSPEFHKIKTVSGAEKAVDYLARKYELVIITSRPHITDKSTKLWLDKHFPGKINSIHHTNQFSRAGSPSRKKSQVCRQLGATVIIEDAIEYALDCHNENIKVYLKEMPWNKDRRLPEGITKFSQWREIKKYL